MKTLLHCSALVDQAPVKSKAWACEDSRNPLQASKTHNPVDRLKSNIASAPSVGSRPPRPRGMQQAPGGRLTVYYNEACSHLSLNETRLASCRDQATPAGC